MHQVPKGSKSQRLKGSKAQDLPFVASHDDRAAVMTRVAGHESLAPLARCSLEFEFQLLGLLSDLANRIVAVGLYSLTANKYEYATHLEHCRAQNRRLGAQHSEPEGHESEADRRSETIPQEI